MLTVDPPRPRSLVPEIPDDLELVLQRAMARDPDERYPTLEAFSEALAPFAPAVAQASAAQMVAPTGECELVGIARRARPEISTLSGIAAVFLVGGFAETFAVGGAGRLAVVAAVACSSSQTPRPQPLPEPAICAMQTGSLPKPAFSSCRRSRLPRAV